MELVDPRLQTYLASGLYFIFICTFILLIVYVITGIIRNRNNLSSPGNITSIQKQQNILLDNRWSSNMNFKQGLTSQFQSIPQDQQLLINASVFSTRLVGCLGPFDSGVFDDSYCPKYWSKMPYFRNRL